MFFVPLQRLAMFSKKKPKAYYVTDQCEVVLKIAQKIVDPILLGKPQIGSHVCYTTFNSPTRVDELDLKGKVVVHRTTAGGFGLIKARGADKIFAAAFVNAEATAETIKKLLPKKVRILPMGHEGTTPSLEDDLCSQYIQGLLEGKTIAIAPSIPILKEGAGKYFFGEDQKQYPKEDFDLCLEMNRFHFAIVVQVEEEIARLSVSVLNVDVESISSSK